MTAQAASTTTPQRAPGPSGLPIFSAFRDFKTRPLELIADLQREHGDVVRLAAGLEMVMFAHPDGVKHVLQDNHLNYKKGYDYERMEPLVGRGLLTSNGDTWKRHRRIAQPSFHRQRIMGFGALMVRHTKRALERWRALGPGAEVDLHAEMMRLTLEIVGEALFSVDLGKGGVEASRVAHALEVTLRMINERVNDLVALPMWVPTPFNLGFKRHRRVLD
ncbi:MAG: cytochrome P450, partial [Myxococcaceae bacterium]|nr:cytochrome P450 [Myxococcaceae bacterium]